MSAPLDSLLAAFERVREPQPDPLSSAIRELPEPGSLPSPWVTWTLIGLFRHHRRQAWVAEVIRTRLRGSAADLAERGSLGHPDDVPPSGPVPGLPEWEYYFHGRGCCITHKIDGDAIDVDFFDDSADYFDNYFYIRYLESLRRPEPPEQRLRELHPSTRAVNIAITDLLAIGALTPLPGRDARPYRLADEVLAASDDIDAFCDAWADRDRRLWIAAVVGDWPAVAAAASGPPELAAITGLRADRCREIRWQRLRPDIDVPHRDADALLALADLPAPDLNQCLIDALNGPPSGFISTALGIIDRQDDPQWCEPIYRLFRRVDPAGEIPEPHIWMASLRFLLRHGFRRPEVVGSLADARRTMEDAVLLSLEHAPNLALPLIRKGLLSTVPIDRRQVAAILALLAAPWCIRELLGALNASDEQEKTADVRAALLECGNEEAQRAVLDWEERNPHENETGNYLEIDGRRVGPFYTLGEIALKNCASHMRYEMDRLYDRVAKVKSVVPPEPPLGRPWWKFW